MGKKNKRKNISSTSTNINNSIQCPKNTTRNKVKKYSNKNNDNKLLESWGKHNSKEYHNFSKDEALQIRNALLQWYRKNRRKLPWRGDCPPYDGSTAGINDNKDVALVKDDKKQLKLDSFFAGSKKKEKKKKIDV